MKVSTFNWASHSGTRGWVVGPFFGRLLRIEIPTAKRRVGLTLSFSRWPTNGDCTYVLPSWMHGSYISVTIQ